MQPVIDLHAHILPDPLKPLLTRWVDEERIQRIRDTARAYLNPFRGALHRIQPALRMLPEGFRKGTDPLSILAAMPGLLVESTPEDLRDVMDRARVDRAVVLAFPPLSSNEYVIDACGQDSRLIAGACLPEGTIEPGRRLMELHQRGARAVLIRPAMDGGGPESETYLELLRTARKLGILVILETGRIQSRVAYTDPEMGRAELYAPWFAEFREVRFVLAHMNFHEPLAAMDLAEEHDNLLLSTSWQPAEIIGEACRRVGAERVVFGSHWPVVGHNMEVGVSRVMDCVSAGMIAAEEADLVLGGNAARVLGLEGLEEPGGEKDDAEEA